MLVNPDHPAPGHLIQSSAESDSHTGNTVALVLAGGKGTRLGALTRNECKPALPFGSCYRNIDFSLSNCVNSGIFRIGVATQYKDLNLIRHLEETWRDAVQPSAGFLEAWRSDAHAGWGYRGTADAVYRNWEKIQALEPELVLVLAGDHIYKMDYRPMLLQHQASGADVTVGCVEVPIEHASEFGVMAIDPTHRVLRFSEKPHRPESLPGHPDRALGSMGIYVFNRKFLGQLLQQDAAAHRSSHDFGRDVLPRIISTNSVYAYPFTQSAAVGAGYWRDVGTISAYWQAHMELLDGVGVFRLDDSAWPLRSLNHPLGITLFNAACGRPSLNMTNSMMACGCTADRATVTRSVLFSNVSIAQNTRLSNAVVLRGSIIGRDCQLSDLVIGPGTRVPDGTIIAPINRREGAREPTLLMADSSLIKSNNSRHQRVHHRHPLRSHQLRRGVGC